MNESKNVRKNVSMMLTGMVIGAALTGGSIAVAAGITAEPTWSPSSWMVSRWKCKPTTLRDTTM